MNTMLLICSSTESTVRLPALGIITLKLQYHCWLQVPIEWWKNIHGNPQDSYATKKLHQRWRIIANKDPIIMYHRKYKVKCTACLRTCSGREFKEGCRSLQGWSHHQDREVGLCAWKGGRPFFTTRATSVSKVHTPGKEQRRLDRQDSPLCYSTTGRGNAEIHKSHIYCSRVLV